MRRGSSGLSLVVGVDKPCGMTSHDVVDRCRRVFGERRVGHTGTLDPMASGAMAVCVGPATKLSAFLTAHDKSYLARITFGTATDTDDAQGEVIHRAPVPARLADEDAARGILAGICGRMDQMPPVYSARKVGGVKSYEAARAGKVIDLSPRPVQVYRAQLAAIGRDGDGALFWDVRLDVSAGTYVRSIARDLGIANGTYAHLGALRRMRSGQLAVDACVALESLEQDPARGRLDPIRLLGIRYAAVDGGPQEKAAANGAPLDPGGLRLLQALQADDARCTSGAAASGVPLADGELVGILRRNELVAIYEYDCESQALRARCGFAQGVSRGTV